jgi:DNA-binding CsgD family transcriptional regulator/PAS domain-containing protein
MTEKNNPKKNHLQKKPVKPGQSKASLKKTGNITGSELSQGENPSHCVVEEKLLDSHQRLLTILDSLNALVYVADMDTYEVLFINKYGMEAWGNIIGQTCWKTLQSGQTGPCEFCSNKHLLDTAGNPKDIYSWEFQNTVNSRWYFIHDRAIQWIDGRTVRLEIATDITKRKKSEQELQKAKDELETRVQERTLQLEKFNTELISEVNERKRIARELTEKNTALKVLLKQREEDRKDLEQNILSNIKSLIQPYVIKLRQNRPMQNQLAYVNIIESNLEEIVAPFSHKLSSHYLKFSPREIQIAHLIRDGMQDKEIAAVLNVSIETIKTHRKNIRKKLNIYSKKANLRTTLLSLSD